jgi:1-phosphofructokinase family hexose kinase
VERKVHTCEERVFPFATQHDLFDMLVMSGGEARLLRHRNHLCVFVEIFIPRPSGHLQFLVMFLTLTPNICIERTVRLNDFRAGEVHRVPHQNLWVNAGGKGINAARVAAACGTPTLALAWSGRNQTPWLKALLDGEGVPHHLIEVAADSRITYNVIHNGTKTEIVEAGQPVAVEEGTLLLEAFTAHVRDARLVALCGSYPPSDHPAFAVHGALLCRIAAQAGKPLIYDGKGEAYANAIRSKTPPWMIKPNQEEAAALLGRSLDTPADERRAVRDLRRRGVEVVLLSCGARGAYLGHPGGIEWFPAPKIEEISPVGSGDSLVGAFAAKWLETGDLMQATAYGVAAGAANAAQERPGFVTPSDIEALLPQVKRSVSEISLMA